MPTASRTTSNAGAPLPEDEAFPYDSLRIVTAAVPVTFVVEDFEADDDGWDPCLAPSKPYDPSSDAPKERNLSPPMDFITPLSSQEEPFIIMATDEEYPLVDGTRAADDDSGAGHPHPLSRFRVVRLLSSTATVEENSSFGGDASSSALGLSVSPCLKPMGNAASVPPSSFFATAE